MLRLECSLFLASAHNSKVMPDAPLLSLVEPREACELTLRQKIRQYTPSLPLFLNPNRVPFRTPLNYLAVLSLPILFPGLVLVILYKFSSESRKSRARVSELDKGWDIEEGKGKGEKDRINQVMRSVIMSVGEDRVDEDPTSPMSERSNVHFLDQDNTTFQPVSNRSPLGVKASVGKLRQVPLPEAQRRMVQSLNDPSVVPRLEKRWTYFDDELSCHHRVPNSIDGTTSTRSSRH
jgi:hypothetical protein